MVRVARNGEGFLDLVQCTATDLSLPTIMSESLLLVNLPVEVLLDNILPLVPAHGLLRLGATNKVRLLAICLNLSL